MRRSLALACFAVLSAGVLAALIVPQIAQPQPVETAQQAEEAKPVEKAPQVAPPPQPSQAEQVPVPQVEKVQPVEPARHVEKVLPPQKGRRADYDGLVAIHAKVNDVPEALVHRVILRESRYQPDLVGHGGTIGLMQIKLATARSLGYSGDAEGLRDPNTNLAYGVKYLAGAYRTANGDHDRAIHYYASGYYEAAKRWRLDHAHQAGPVLASASPQPGEKPEERAKSKDVAAGAKHPAAGAKRRAKTFADAEAAVPRPPADIPAGANAKSAPR